MDIPKFICNFKADDALMIMFDWNGLYAEDLIDRNLLFRRQILDHYATHKKEFPLELILTLYEAETEYSRQAWGIHPLVSDLAQDLLERGRTKYIKEYLYGMGGGMDNYLTVRMIELSSERKKELLAYCEEDHSDEEDPLSQDVIAIFKDFLLNL